MGSTNTSNNEKWDGRTRFVVYGQAFLFVLVWFTTLGRNFGDRFWNRDRNVDRIDELLEDERTPTILVTTLKLLTQSYYTTRRYHWFLPHVVGAVIWWNLYFVQFIPSIRRNHKKFHRVLGRILLLCALSQTITGFGMASTANSPTSKIVSYTAGTAVLYCIANAFRFAYARDIAKHKYWAIRLVGYLHGITLQRLFMIVLFASWQLEWTDMYPPFDPEDSDTMQQAFDDSFVLGTLVATFLTEWYLAGIYGWTETTKENKVEERQPAGTATDSAIQETTPLNGTTTQRTRYTKA